MYLTCHNPFSNAYLQIGFSTFAAGKFICSTSWMKVAAAAKVTRTSNGAEKRVPGGGQNVAMGHFFHTLKTTDFSMSIFSIDMC